MKVTCDYCSTTYEDTLPECPNCGAPNPTHKSDNNPRTIAELKQWYIDRHLPPAETTRFFIGVDYQQPKAFGIFQDTNGDFVVYKNKADGSRAIRYRGKDETYAVNELLQKLKDEIVHQKGLNHNRVRPVAESKIFRLVLCLWVVIFGTGILSIPVQLITHRHDGYYNYGVPYYKDGSDWYIYESYGQWDLTDEPIEYSQGYTTDDYYMGSSFDAAKGWQIDDIEFSDVKNSSTWSDNHTSSSSDSSYDWDSSDSWDSSGSDWDSDW